MTRTSWVELYVSDFEQSITWFERVLGFRIVARDANEYAELSRGETFLQLAGDDAPDWKSERPRMLPPGQRGNGVEIILLVDNVEAVYRQAQQTGLTSRARSPTIPGTCDSSGCAIPTAFNTTGHALQRNYLQ